MANAGPADYNYDETLSTLRYANRAKSIQNSAKINEDPKDALLRQFQKEIEELRRKLEEEGVCMVRWRTDLPIAAWGGVGRLVSRSAQWE